MVIQSIMIQVKYLLIYLFILGHEENIFEKKRILIEQANKRQKDNSEDYDKSHIFMVKDNDDSSVDLVNNLKKKDDKTQSRYSETEKTEKKEMDTLHSHKSEQTMKKDVKPVDTPSKNIINKEVILQAETNKQPQPQPQSQQPTANAPSQNRKRPPSNTQAVELQTLVQLSPEEKKLKEFRDKINKMNNDQLVIDDKITNITKHTTEAEINIYINRPFDHVQTKTSEYSNDGEDRHDEYGSNVERSVPNDSLFHLDLD